MSRRPRYDEDDEYDVEVSRPPRPPVPPASRPRPRTVKYRDRNVYYVEKEGDLTRETTQPTSRRYGGADISRGPIDIYSPLRVKQYHQPRRPTVTNRLGDDSGEDIYNTSRTRAREYDDNRNQPIASRRRSSRVAEYRGAEVYGDDYDRRSPLRSASDAGSDGSYYGEFSLSLRQKGVLGGNLKPGLASEPSENNEEDETAVEPPTIRPSSDKETIRRILFSKYTSGAFGRGEFRAALTVGQDPTSERRRILPGLFRWIHMKCPMMNFGSFLDSATKTTGLDEKEKGDILALLERTREACEMPLLTPQGVRGRYLEPTFIRESTYKGAGQKRRQIRSVSFLCIPYFALDKYASPSLPDGSTAHPMRTLLQSHYSSSPRKRDMQQAVRRLGYTPAEYCFHVPQLWCLILNDTLLITCTRLSPLELHGKTITTQSVPSPVGGDPITHLQVSDGRNRVWLLPLEECGTWFQFISTFSEMADFSDEELQVSLKGTVITPENWTSVVAQARKSPIRVSITIKDRPYIRAAAADADSGDETSAVESVHSEKDDTGGDAGPSGQQEVTREPIVIPWPPPTENTERKSDQPRRGKDSEPRRPGRGPPRVVRYGRGGPSNKGVPQQVMHRDLSEFHVFTWMFVASPKTDVAPTIARDDPGNVNEKANLPGKTENTPEVDGVDEIELQSTLNDMHEFLMSNKNRRERTIYKRVRPRTLKEVNELVQKFESLQEVDDRLQSSNTEQRRFQRLATKNKKKLLDTCKEVFEFFFPLDIESQVILKYWGAAYRLIERADGSTLYTSVSTWISLQKDIKTNLSGGRGPTVGQITVPEEFAKAWIPCVMQCIFSQAEFRFEEGNQASKCKEMLRKGQKELMQSLIKSPIRDKEAVLPLGLMSLVTDKLLQDDTNGYPDLSSTYYDYWVKIQADFQAHPYYRSHQEKVTSLIQEIAIIIKTLDAQLRVLTDLQEIMGPSGNERQSRYDSQRASKLPKERDYTIIASAISSINAKRQAFREITELAGELAVLNIQMIATNKDRQEAAILVFTIVTIVFLPLSFVSSFLGMNTYDIRNMNNKQPLFWAIALPLTLLIVGVSVLAAGEAETIIQWVKRFWIRVFSRRGGPGRETLGDGAAMVEYPGRPDEKPFLMPVTEPLRTQVYLPSRTATRTRYPPPPTQLRPVGNIIPEVPVSDDDDWREPTGLSRARTLPQYI